MREYGLCAREQVFASVQTPVDARNFYAKMYKGPTASEQSDDTILPPFLHPVGIYEDIETNAYSESMS